MYINTFKYTPKDVSCQLCTEYVKKLGCTALRCPWLAERIEAGVVGYREAVLETFPHERRLFQRLNLLIKHYPGSLWSNEQHERRMQYQCAVQGYRRRRDTNAYYAAMYLLTSNDDIYRRTANCFCKDGIEFGYEDVGDSYIGAVFAARSMELWLLEDMGFAVVAKFSVNAGEGEYVTEYRVYKGSDWADSEISLDLEDLVAELAALCDPYYEHEQPIYEL